MTTQYRWEGKIYFPNDIVKRVKPGTGHILVPRGVSGTGGGSGGSAGNSPINPLASFTVNPVNPTVPITPPVIKPPPTTGGSNPPPQTITPFPMTAPNGQPIFGTYQVYTVAHNGNNVNVNVPQGYYLQQTATGWQVTNGTNVIWSVR